MRRDNEDLDLTDKDRPVEHGNDHPSEVEQEPIVGTETSDTLFGSTEMRYTSGWNGWMGGVGGNDLLKIEHDAADIPHYVDHPVPLGQSGTSGVADGFTVHGGSGSDTVSYATTQHAIDAYMHTGRVSIEHTQLGLVDDTLLPFDTFKSDQLYYVENLRGTQFEDRITGNDDANQLFGGKSKDVIWGEGGNDRVEGEDGNDILYGGAGEDTVLGGAGHDTLDGGLHNDTLDGGSGNDDIKGGSGTDSLKGGDDDDTLDGGGAGDRLEGGLGDDTLDGGPRMGVGGADTAVYDTNGHVYVDLAVGEASGAMGNDVLISIENVETGNGDDVVFGSNGANVIETGGDTDIVHAMGGDDVVDGGSGDDTLIGYTGEDELTGGFGNDDLYGMEQADDLRGNNGEDRLDGGEGDDTLNGGASDDLLIGGAGGDTVTGGVGADVFLWVDGDIGYDIVKDFDPGEDRLSFGPGFFAEEPVGAVQLEDVLVVFNSGPDAVLGANTAEAGWTEIALLENVDASVIDQMIENESILSVEAVDFGQPDEWAS